MKRETRLGRDGVRPVKRSRVVSISLPPDLLAAIDRLGGHPGFNGRSDVVRAGVQSLLQELASEPRPGDRAAATLTLAYDSEVAGQVTRLRHVFDDVIRTIMHTHQPDGSCLEIVMVEGLSERIQALRASLLGRDGVRVVRLVWVRPDGPLPATGSAPQAPSGPSS